MQPSSAALQHKYGCCGETANRFTRLGQHAQTASVSAVPASWWRTSWSSAHVSKPELPEAGKNYKKNYATMRCEFYFSLLLKRYFLNDQSVFWSLVSLWVDPTRWYQGHHFQKPTNWHNIGGTNIIQTPHPFLTHVPHLLHSKQLTQPWWPCSIHNV